MASPPPPAAPEGYRPRFLAKHALRYGLEVTARDAETSAVTLAVCLFCRHFGREERPGNKRKPAATIKYFRPPFRTDQYLQHLTLQHPRQWETYKSNSDAAKQSFFPTDLTRPEPDKRKVVDQKEIAEVAAAARASEVEKHCWFLIPKRIVDLVVPFAALRGGPGWQPTGFRACEVVALTKAQAQREEALVAAQDGEKEQYYRVAIFMRMQLDVAVDALAIGLSPRQASQYLAALARRTTGTGGDVPSFPLLAVEDTRELARLMVSESLQLTGKCLERSWGFGLVLREVTVAPSVPQAGYLDVRVVVCVQGKLRDIHVLALPGFERRTASALAQAVESVLDAVFPMWRSRMLGITQDGYAPIAPAGPSGEQPALGAPSLSSCTQRSADVLAFLEASARTSTPATPRRVLYCTWGACRQVSLPISSFYDSLLGGGFLPVLRTLTAYIRRHPVLVHDMGEPPSVSIVGGGDTKTSSVGLDANTEWLAMGLDAQWITDKRVRLRKHLEQRSASAEAPSTEVEAAVPVDDVWWVAFFVVQWVSARANEAFEKLRLPRSSRGSQAQTINEMAEELTSTFRIKANKEEHAQGEEAERYFSRQGKVSILKSSVDGFLGDQGIFVSNVVARVGSAALDAVLEVDLSSEAEASDGAPKLPPVLPHELAQLSGREFTELLQLHEGQLRTLYSDEDLDTVEQEYQALRRAVTRETELKAALAHCNEETSFKQAWTITKNQFPTLQAFAGGLASAYAGRDGRCNKSLVGLALGAASKDESGDDGLGLDVTDFVLEAALHARQFDAVAALYQSG